MLARLRVRHSGIEACGTQRANAFHLPHALPGLSGCEHSRDRGIEDCHALISPDHLLGECVEERATRTRQAMLGVFAQRQRTLPQPRHALGDTDPVCA
jgi:hypothetical protein